MFEGAGRSYLREVQRSCLREVQARSCLRELYKLDHV